MDDRPRQPDLIQDDGFVRVRGAREHNLRNVDVRIPRNALVVFTGVSGSGKSSLAFGTICTGLHPRDVERLIAQLERIVGNSVIVVEHDMDDVAHSDWIIDLGPGAGDEGGNIVASGTPHQLAKAVGKTARYLARRLEQ
ncbi:hypothetical protein [Bradyrhizobium yuanmingense]|uniref:hypothetical protein n=1 Tax=Bradyrhizobium yuanmingense TaxID=108015 RepID=UPI003F6AEDD4